MPHKETAKKLMPFILEELKKQKSDFWIDPEEHYNDHRRFEGEIDKACHRLSEDEVYEMKRIIKNHRVLMSLLSKALITFIVIGSGILIVIGINASKF